MTQPMYELREAVDSIINLCIMHGNTKWPSKSTRKYWHARSRERVTPTIVSAIETGIMRGSVNTFKWYDLQSGWRKWCYHKKIPYVVLHDSHMRHTITVFPPPGCRLPQGDNGTTNICKMVTDMIKPFSVFKTVKPYVTPYTIKLVMGKPTKSYQSVASEDPLTVARMLYDLVMEHMEERKIGIESL